MTSSMRLLVGTLDAVGPEAAGPEAPDRDVAPRDSHVSLTRAASESRAARLAAVVVAEHDFVWRSLRRLGVPPVAAEDALSKVFDVLAARIDDVVPGKERAFLFRVAASAARGERRALTRLRAREAHAADWLYADAPADPETLVGDAERLRVLDELLATLDDEARAVFVLHELEEMSRDDCAEILVTSPGTVASRLRRARAAFDAAVRRYQAVSRRRAP